MATPSGLMSLARIAGDSTRHYLDKFGAPKVIKDAFGRVIKLTPEGTWPALVSQITYPNGRITRATYNGRGMWPP